MLPSVEKPVRSRHMGRAGPFSGEHKARQLDELRALIARHARPDGTTPIDGVFAASVETAETHTSPSGTVFALIAQGAKVIGIGDRVYEYGAGQYLVASLDLPVTGHFSGASPSRPALGFALELRPSTISSLLLELAPPKSLPASEPSTPHALGVADAGPDLLDAVTRVLALLDTPKDQPVLAPMLEREIVWRLLTGPLGATVRQLGLADSTLIHVSRAVRWITEHYDEPFRVEDLAHSCGMSPSAFHRKFRAVTALSPIQFQKQIRLQTSRMLLMSGGNDIASVGHQVGYDSSSQFTREYRRQFGLPPGRDAARLRGDVPPGWAIEHAH
jgi:AraC-like DNA-binding protein